MVRDSLWTAPTEHHLMSLRAKRAGGLRRRGRADGRPGGVWVFDPPDGGRAGRTGHRARRPTARPRRWPGVVDPETKVLDPDGSYVYPFPPAGHATAPGADPALRQRRRRRVGRSVRSATPSAVKRDVRDGYVTIEGAARDYGVVVVGDPDEDPEGLTLDLAATERLRADRGA